MNGFTNKLRVPVVQQFTQYECGLCCLKMILSYYRYNISMNELRKYFDCSVNGISLYDLKLTAKKFNLNVNIKKVDSSLLFKLKKIKPMIISWNNSHYVILEKILKDSCIIIDPDVGKRKISYDEFKNSFSGYILLVEPNKDFISIKKSNKVYSYLKKFLKYKYTIIFLLILSALLQLISIGTPVLIKNIVDKVIVSPVDSLNIFIIFAILILISQVCVLYAKNILIISFQKKIDYELLNKFVNHMLNLSYKFFQLRNCGDLIQRLISNNIIRDILIQKIIPGFMNTLLIFIIFIYMYIQSKFLACTVLVLGIIQFLVILLSKSKMKLLTQSQVMAQTELNNFLTEIIKGISTIKAMGIEMHAKNAWDEILRNQVNSTSKKSKFQNDIDLITNTIISFSPLFIIFVGISQVNSGSLTIGGVLAFQSLTSSFLNPINFLATIINDFTMLSVLLERINDVLDEPQEEVAINNKKEMLGSINIKNVSFRYSQDGTFILKNISFSINAGERVAIVGQSGCGKSTLGSVICGLYKPTDGAVIFDNKSNNFSKDYLGVVMQDNFLFNKSISENICIGLNNVNLEEIEKAAKIAAIDEEIRNFPMKYNTLLSETATNLSGGQKQRISIARAIIRKPSILLLDEATSALDAITESKIINNLKELNCTQIIIAHRLSTIINSDKIIVLNKGEIIDIGRHEDLIKQCFYYKNLYENSICINNK